jgi:predicted transposase/invertase (TIGR01784 family)
MLVNAIARDRKKMYEKGLKEGGMKEKREISRAMLARDMAISDIAAITGLSEKDIREIT